MKGVLDSIVMRMPRREDNVLIISRPTQGNYIQATDFPVLNLWFSRTSALSHNLLSLAFAWWQEGTKKPFWWAYSIA